MRELIGPPMGESCLKTNGAIENGIYRAWRSMRNGILEVRNCHFTRVVRLGTFDSQSNMGGFQLDTNESDRV